MVHPLSATGKFHTNCRQEWMVVTVGPGLSEST